jgi:hypothetical protein
MVIEVPVTAEETEKPVISGAAVASTVKYTELLASPLTVTTTLPLLDPVGTGTVMAVLVQSVGLAVFPLKVTLLLDPVPKFEPLIVTDVATGAPVGEIEVIFGTGRLSVKVDGLLAWPFTVTTTPPVLAPLGTLVEMLVELQFVTTAGVPLNVTVLLCWVGPKLLPEIVTAVPTDPLFGERLIVGGDQVTVNQMPLLGY